MESPTYVDVMDRVKHFDIQLGKVSKRLNSQGKSIRRIEQKVYNGYDEKIDALQDRVAENKADNAVAHEKLERSLGGIIKFGAGAFLLLFITLLTILGSIWLHDRPIHEPIPVEVVADDFDNPNESAP